MVAHYTYAVIDSDNIVRQMGVSTEPNIAFFDHVAHATYGEYAYAMDVTQYACQEGDIYDAGRSVFTRGVDGETITIGYTPTSEQEISSLQHTVKDLQAQNDDYALLLADMIGG